MKHDCKECAARNAVTTTSGVCSECGLHWRLYWDLTEAGCYKRLARSGANG